MIRIKHKDSVLDWNEEKGLGNFEVTSNRGKSAKGVMKKSNDGRLIALIETMNYARSYGSKKVLSTLNAIFENQNETVFLQQAIDCLSGYIYTDEGEASGLDLGDPHTISGSYRHYCINGAYDCGGDTYQGPEDVHYMGVVIGVCAGVVVEYAKFKIN